jgi:hypothetical protein
VASNFSKNRFEPQAKRLTFSCIMTATNANLTVLAGKLHYVTFGVIRHRLARCFFLCNATNCCVEGFWVTFGPGISSSYCTHITQSMCKSKLQAMISKTTAPLQFRFHFCLLVLGNANYSVLMPEILITFFHFCVSLRIKRENSSFEFPPVSAPNF